MTQMLRYLFCQFARFVLALRYRVRAEGLDRMKGLTRTLILPNHPAYIDPPIVLSQVWPALHPRPMLFAAIFRNPLLFWLPHVLNGLEIPNLEEHSAEARQQAQNAIDAIIAGLQRGENFILWPSGRVQQRNVESLGAARSLAEIVRQVPDANIVVIRTRGLWGSMFSCARTGTKPKLPRVLLKGMRILLANLIFFAPRRRVHLTVEQLDRNKLPELTREKINPFFEKWYNAPGPESPTYVPYHHLFGPRTFDYPKIESHRQVSIQQIQPEIRKAICEIISEKLNRELSATEQNPDTGLETLGLDSLDRMELSLTIEQRFGFTSDQVPVTVGDLFALAQGLAEHAPTKPPPLEWFKEGGTREGGRGTREPVDSEPRAQASDQAAQGGMGMQSADWRTRGDCDKAAVLAETIPQAFVKRAIANRKDVVAADDLSGAVTYGKFLVGALTLAKRFRRIAAPNVGLMLPASVAADMAYNALQLAGKLPVLMNWTTGPANLAHAVKIMGLTHVITSRKFVDRTAIIVEGAEYIYLEELRAKMKKPELLWTLLRVRLARNSILRQLPAVSPDDDAVVLFTSGSERAPKAVPLTHRNILSNLRAVLDAYDISQRDSMLGFLPVFHSFGITVTSLLPVLASVRVVHHADPTDAAALARKVAAYRPTLICGTPTFIGYILDRCKPQDLVSVRMIVVGAEKCPLSMYDRVAQLAPNASLLEGYGITECSPLVSCNRLEQIKRGSIGLPLPGVEVQVVDPDTFEPLPQGQMGMLLVAGPNVFHGYIGHEGPQPFAPQPSSLVPRPSSLPRRYITGDLAHLDSDGFIFFDGRLKRFLKAGGEMISLPALEEPFTEKYPPTEEGPRVAVEGIETESGRRIVLFTTEPIALAEANALLTAKGFRGIMRLDEVRRIESIPVLGTGKTDYKVLRNRITQTESETRTEPEAQARAAQQTSKSPDIQPI